ncbi:hypothetical protein EJ110_NYTH43983 [Nymphaea thermarum]|nr:hypothetical protein EJ110_NYTH43983 [Nymphaea thermarum]
MDKLRLLMINHVNIIGGQERMPKHFELLQWQRCPLKSFPSNFHFKEVAALDLSYSDIINAQRSNKVSSTSTLNRIHLVCFSCHCLCYKKRQLILSLPLLFIWVFGIIKQLSGRIQATGTIFEKLKFLDLTACKNVSTTSDLSIFSGLVKLVLDRCENLIKVHESIYKLAALNKLRFIGALHKPCMPTKLCPASIRARMKHLKELDLSA